MHCLVCIIIIAHFLLLIILGGQVLGGLLDCDYFVTDMSMHSSSLMNCYQCMCAIIIVYFFVFVEGVEGVWGVDYFVSDMGMLSA